MNWSMIRKSKRRFSSALLCVTMVCSMFTNTTSLSVLAAQGNPTGKKLVCEKEEHSHTADCYEPGELSCTLDEEEGHTHDEDCYEETLICDNAEEGHEHTADCYEKSLICGKEESKGHTHGSKCYEQTLICDTEEHTHNADCYEIVEDTSEPEDTKEPEKEPVKPGDTTESEKETVKPGEITEPEEDTVKPDNTTEPEEDTVKPDKTTEPGKETAIPSDATEKKCTCTSLCTEDEFNVDCPVCSEDYTACELAKDADVENDLPDKEAIKRVKELFEAILTDYFADRSEENTIAKIVENMDEDTLAACMEQTVDAMNAFDGLTTGECDAFIAENEELYNAIYTELAEALAGRVNNDIAVYAEGYTAGAKLNKIENTAMAYDKVKGIVTITMPDFASTTYTKNGTTVNLQFKYDIYVDDDFGDSFFDIGTPTYPDKTVTNKYKIWGFGNISSGDLTANGQTQIDLKGVAYTQKIDINLIACSKETGNAGKPYWYGYAYYVLPNKITYDLNGGNIAGSADAKTEYLLKDDALATTFAEPTREGYAFAGWGTSTSGGTVTAATGVKTTLYAHWTQKQSYTVGVTASPTAGGTVTGGGTYEGGTAVTVKATANSGYHFAGWKEGEATVSTEAEYTFTVSKNVTLTAVFEQDKAKYTVTLETSPSGGGTVTGGGTYEDGSSVTVKAAANSGYHFAGWKEGEATVSASAEYTFTASKNMTLTAVFEQDKAKYTVTLETSPSGGGTATGGGSYEDGTAVTVKATANSGYHFAGWKEGEATVSTEAEYTFTASKDIELTAVFEQNKAKYTVGVTASPTAGGTVTGGGTYEDGTSVTVKATANSDYHFAGWKEGEATVSTEAEYTFTVSKDVELIAVFEKEEGRTQVDVEVDSNAPNTQMNTDKQKLVDSNILTEAEKQQVEDGEAAYIRLKVKALSEDSIPLADKTLLLAAAEKLAGAGANLTYIDISLYKQIGNNGAETKVKDILNTKISVTITIPEEIRTAPDGKNRSFSILRVHKGETEAATINGVYEQSTGAFTFETDRFSTYAIAYKDTPAPDTYYDVKVSSGKAGAGTVTGGGRYQENTSVTVTATANSGYEFVRWTENAVEVSTNANYTFSITGSRDLVAEFKTTGGGSTGGGSTGGGGSDNSSSSQTPGKHRDGSYDSTFTPSTKESGGTFHGSGNDWTYIKADGTQAKSEWIASGGDWYYFGEDGKMKFDWFLDPKSNLWYMLSRNHDGRFGAALRGWYYEDQDGKWYFLNPVTSEMMTGWQYIDHKRYYFAPSNEGQTYFGDNVNGWYFDPTRNIRPFGSMYRDEETPDGHRVDGNGARVQ